MTSIVVRASPADLRIDEMRRVRPALRQRIQVRLVLAEGPP